MNEACVPSGCQCACHRHPGVSHVVACCNQPPYRVECNGLCLTGGDIGFPGSGIAYAHPDCELHGRWAAYNVDGTPR